MSSIGIAPCTFVEVRSVAASIYYRMIVGDHIACISVGYLPTKKDWLFIRKHADLFVLRSPYYSSDNLLKADNATYLQSFPVWVF